VGITKKFQIAIGWNIKLASQNNEMCVSSFFRNIIAVRFGNTEDRDRLYGRDNICLSWVPWKLVGSHD